MKIWFQTADLLFLMASKKPLQKEKEKDFNILHKRG